MADIGPRACAELRRAAARNRSVDVLAAEYAVDPATVRRHLWGRCQHEIDEPVVPLE